VRSRAALEDLLGVGVTSFAYPFGTRADYNDATAACCARRVHDRLHVAARRDHARQRRALRAAREGRGRRGLWMFRSLARGGLDGWRWVDRTLWRMQAAEA
jgi:hypothetical protein